MRDRQWTLYIIYIMEGRVIIPYFNIQCANYLVEQKLFQWHIYLSKSKSMIMLLSLTLYNNTE